jgi:hypothetical protein
VVFLSCRIPPRLQDFPSRESAGPVQRLYSKKNMVYGTLYAGVDYNSSYLIVNSIVSYPYPHYKGTGAEWEKSLLLV